MTSDASRSAAWAARSRAGWHAVALRAASRLLRNRSDALGTLRCPTAPILCSAERGSLILSATPAPAFCAGSPFEGNEVDQGHTFGRRAPPQKPRRTVNIVTFASIRATGQ